MNPSRHILHSPARTSPERLVRTVWLVLLTLVIVPALAPDTATAQSMNASDVNMGAIERKIELIYPKSGPPGTVVRVNTEDMPVITPIRVGIGAAQAGFEAFQELMTGQEGEFDVSVEVPEWASWDRVHLFIVFDIYFRPIALSDAFHVTNEDGLVRRTGRVTHRDDGCSILRDIDGVQYALLGEGEAIEGIEPETTVTLDGRIIPREECGLLNVLEVTSVRTD
ncbi:MAG: hypothetical protein WEA34_13325 [Gemmatimonadota bacterium]